MVLPGFSSCKLGSAAATSVGATAQTSLRAEGAKTPLRVSNCEASCLAGSLAGAVAGTQARLCNFSRADVRLPPSSLLCLFKCSKRTPARLKSLSLMIASASSTESSHVISLFIPQRCRTFQTTSALSPASLSTAPIFTRFLLTTLKAWGLFSGSKESPNERDVPSSVGTHFVSASLRPTSLMSASFQVAAHSRNVSRKTASWGPLRPEAAGSTTSALTRAGGMAAKTALRCSSIEASTLPSPASFFTCSTRICGSFSTVLPGLSSWSLGSASATRQGATAQTNLRCDGKKTSFRASNCLASLAATSIEGVVAGTQANVCSFSRAGVRAPFSFECCFSKCAKRWPARVKSLSLTIASASKTASSQVISCFMPHCRSTRQAASDFKPASVSSGAILARCAFTTLKASGLFSGSKDAEMVRAVPSSPGTHLTSDSLVPKSRISVSFHDPAHSTNASKNGVRPSWLTLATAGITTSLKVRAGVSAPKTARKCSTIDANDTAFLPAALHAESVTARSCSTSTGASDSTLRPGLSSCTFVSPEAQSDGATAQTNFLADGAKTSFSVSNCLASSVVESADGFVAGIQARRCSFSSAAALLPVSLSWFLSMCAYSCPERGKSLSRTMVSASSAASSHVISRFKSHKCKTRQITSALAPTSVIKASMLAFLSRTMLNTAGLFVGSKASLIVRTEPSSTGMHLTPAIFLPRSLMSASFQEPAHSQNTTNKLVSFGPVKLVPVGRITSEIILLVGSAPKAATMCFAATMEVIALESLVATAQSANFCSCCTRIAGSDSTFRPGLNSSNVGSASMQSAGATANTNLRADGRNTSFKANNCVAFCASGSMEGDVAGTQARLCNCFSAAARPPLRCEFCLFRCWKSSTARGMSLSVTTA
mmetsp:Transcript_124328/g.310843  ORF Transcript_124328/g.310843 Transcript_124328/m.310843 type:complete len:886 (-) Transcript_124328:997-3654(-)